MSTVAALSPRSTRRSLGRPMLREPPRTASDSPVPKSRTTGPRCAFKIQTGPPISYARYPRRGGVDHAQNTNKTISWQYPRGVAAAAAAAALSSKHTFGRL